MKVKFLISVRFFVFFFLQLVEVSERKKKVNQRETFSLSILTLFLSFPLVKP